MKKLIVIVMFFMAATCWADVQQDFFKEMKILDMTELANVAPDESVGMYGISDEEFLAKSKEYFEKNLMVLKPWTSTGDATYCTAVSDGTGLFVICIDEKKIIFKVLK